MNTKTKIYRNNPRKEKNKPKGTAGRLFFVVLILFALFGVVLAKLVKVQVFEHAYYREKARKNVENRKEIPARRGAIYDRKGRKIAEDILYYSLAVDPEYIKNKSRLERALSRTLGIAPATIRKKLSKKSRYTYLDRKVNVEEASKLQELKEPGLIFERHFSRQYYYNENGAHLIGFCGDDNKPLAGIELQYDHYLQGKPGWKIYLRDARGNQLPDLDIAGEDPIDGFDITLSLDMDYQSIVEDELRAGVTKHEAQEGVAILMEPNTGEILALANYPQFNPNHFRKFDQASMRNRAITDVVEPGSTFKLTLLSAALEQLHLNLDKDIFFCENGRFRLYGQTILDHKAYGWLTLRRVIENSSNIGCMKVAQQLKKETFYRYVRNYGFGMITGVDLPGESPGILHPLEDFSKTSLYYMSIGYEIGVTPLQLLNAYSAVANGGDLMHPYVLEKVSGTDNRLLLANKPQVIRQVVSPETSELMKTVFAGVVEEGTGVRARLDGVSIAGKTGTAQIFDPETGDYNHKEHLASFVGFFPADNPSFALLVMIRQPRGEYYGGLVAAPVFHNIARRISSLVPQKVEEKVVVKTDFTPSQSAPVPNVKNMNLEAAKSILRDLGYQVKTEGKGNIVDRQEEVAEDGKNIGVCLFLKEGESGDLGIMPALKGLTIKEALTIISDYELTASVEGHGTVVGQYPSPGAKLNGDKQVKLVCKPS